MAKINCKTTTSLIDLFFEHKLSSHIVNLICEHLSTCKECRKSYLKYIKQNFKSGQFYNVYVILDSKIAISGATLQEAYNEDVDELVREGYFKKVDESNMQWLDFAKEFDIFKLAQLKCFRDFTREYKSIGDDNTFDYNDFNKFMAIKFCKQIDHLERCYRKEFTEVEK